MLNIEKHLTLNKYKSYFKVLEKTFHRNIRQANRSWFSKNNTKDFHRLLKSNKKN